ncbi:MULTISPECIES: S-Ena type endospore appendage [unclassified Viridibacillus]|uniref:S-Ena type endospore appendage n=1 Tax=unclassified Viridibacillus TaxID=2617942 RepID=UPI00096DDB09|nr:S-Ena type endospore appendage [Viridibacillus sp. FSL H7-0596]OMC89056.1 hypothetical protein BK128_03760 [Viridibacillus sp. FSL H7-0596]
MCMGKDKHKDDCCFSCCDEKEFIVDKLCCDFNVTGYSGAETFTTLYTSDLTTACNLIASGFIKNCGNTSIIVQFVRGVNSGGSGGTVIRTLVIPVEGCATFVVSHFDVIRAQTESGTQQEHSPGELCITQRFPIH